MHSLRIILIFPDETRVAFCFTAPLSFISSSLRDSLIATIKQQETVRAQLMYKKADVSNP